MEVDGLPALIPIQATMSSLIACTAAMLVVNLAPPAYAKAAAVVALLGAVPALYRILSLFLFWGAPPEQGSLLSSMGIHTALLIVWFMVCILMHPRLGLGEILFQHSLRGRVVRRVLPVVVFVPIVAAASSLELSLAQGWGNEVLFGLIAMLTVTVSATLVWQLSRQIADWQGEATEHSNHLARANEALEQYASSAAHDLKAPVRHVSLYGELLQDALANDDLNSAKKYAGNICAAVSELPPIIDGMLDYSRSGYSKLSPGDNKLSEVVQAATSLQESDLRTVGARVTLLREAVLWCDFQLMTSVFQNLIANSLNHRRKDRSLEIQIDVTQSNNGVTIAVIDNGLGFDPQFAAVAINPLARGVRLAGDGSGIGLSICRTILRSHGGDIRVDPTFKGGARIELSVPQRVQEPSLQATNQEEVGLASSGQGAAN